VKDEPWTVNLHDWIDELMDVLDVEVEMDEGLVLDVARQAAHRVQRPAAPISTFLLGYAAGLQEGGTEEIEALAGRVLALAESWEGGEDLEAGLAVDEADLADAAVPLDEAELVDAD
jgi:hypothetical protein